LLSNIIEEVKLRRFRPLLDVGERGGMKSQYPLLSLEAVRIGWGSHDETNLAVEDVSFEVWAGRRSCF
jgi:hypothetical protein